MANEDLAHIDKDVQRLTTDADYARQQAESQRVQADQHRARGDEDGAAYNDREAMRFEQQATDLDASIAERQAAKEQTLNRLSELQQERDKANREHDDKLRQIENEETQLRGTGALL